MSPSHRTLARFSHALATSAVAIALFGCTTAMPPSMPHPLLGQMSPRFDAETVDERQVSVPSYGAARVMVVNFWASWCGTCRATTPALERLWRDRRRDGLLVVGVSIDDEARKALTGAYRFGMTFPVVHDRGQDLLASYGVGQVPTTFVLDAGGRVRFVGRDPESIKRAVIALMDR